MAFIKTDDGRLQPIEADRITHKTIMGPGEGPDNMGTGIDWDERGVWSKVWVAPDDKAGFVQYSAA